MRFKTAFMLAIGSACLLALSIVDFRHPPPDRAQPQRARPTRDGKGRSLSCRLASCCRGRFACRRCRLQWRGCGRVRTGRGSAQISRHQSHRRKRLWCATFMNLVLAKLGYAGTKSDVARSFLHYGRRLSGPRIGAIAVLTRGKEGGHVGVVTGVDAHRNPILISGNFNRQRRHRRLSARAGDRLCRADRRRARLTRPADRGPCGPGIGWPNGEPQSARNVDPDRPRARAARSTM